MGLQEGKAGPVLLQIEIKLFIRRKGFFTSRIDCNAQTPLCCENLVFVRTSLPTLIVNLVLKSTKMPKHTKNTRPILATLSILLLRSGKQPGRSIEKKTRDANFFLEDVTVFQTRRPSCRFGPLRPKQEKPSPCPASCAAVCVLISRRAVLCAPAPSGGGGDGKGRRTRPHSGRRSTAKKWKKQSIPLHLFKHFPAT